MTVAKVNTEARKRRIADLWIIGIVSFLALGGVVFAMQNGMNDFAGDHGIPIVLRALVIGLCGQFAVSGLGISIVCLIRKQRFRDFGLNTKNLVPALLLSLLCCVPELTYYLVRGYVSGWCLFQGVNTTAEVLASTFPSNIIGFLITALFWGFFEGFNYVVIRDKISMCFPSRYRFFDWGAFVCAVMCILVHGAVGVTPDALAEMAATFILIYGMLIVRKETGNAWGCILIFFVYWNAI
ncbi:MAG: hypothetical protein ACI3V0_11315 [Faecousia sp.]